MQRNTRQLILTVSICAALCAVYVLSEGPARWLLGNRDWTDNTVVYATLVEAYRPLESGFEYLPRRVREAREAYLNWFAPDWLGESFLHLD